MDSFINLANASEKLAARPQCAARAGTVLAKDGVWPAASAFKMRRSNCRCRAQ